MSSARYSVHLPVAAQPSLETLFEIGVLAESEGYDRVWMPETWGRDAVTVLSGLADRTDHIGLGTSITSVYSRSPALVGQTAVTLQELAGGRFRLGLGPSGPTVVENWHGESFERPLLRVKEYVEIVRLVMSGELVDYRGECFEVGGFRLRFEPTESPPSIDLAAMGPAAVTLAGRVADGWQPLLMTPSTITDRYNGLVEGAATADRDPSALQVTPIVLGCALPDGDRARWLAKQHIAFYVGAMGSFYRDSLSNQGYSEVVNEITAKWQAGDRDGATDMVPESLLERLAATGTPPRARSLIEDFAAIPEVDSIAIGFPRAATPNEIRETVRALRPTR